MLRRFRSLPVRVRLTISYLAVLAVILGLFMAGTAVVLDWQMRDQLAHFAIEDIETVEGLLSFNSAGLVELNQNYHNHPQSRLISERLLEVLSPEGVILYRNENLGNLTLGGVPFRGEGVGGYSERTDRLAGGESVLLVSRRHLINGKPVLIRLAYYEKSISSNVNEFLTASATALPVLLALAGVFAYFLAKGSLAPLQQMAGQAEQITAEQLHQRLPVANPSDELGHLATVINSVLDRLEQSFERLRRFTADASHDLRTPLAALRTVGEVGLQKSRSAADYQDTIGSMLEEVGRLTRLVENLLTLSRADQRQIQPALTVFPLNEVVREAANVIEVLAEEKGQTLTVRLDDEVAICGDRVLLRQAVLNVLHNAVKYSPVQGSVSVWLSHTRDRAQVRISDNGPGIAAEHHDRIFDRFYRVDISRTGEGGGTGLGLSIAKWAVELQGGTIAVEDNSVGSTFCIELPRGQQ
jgi:heavy metal sensor kinase